MLPRRRNFTFHATFIGVAAFVTVIIILTTRANVNRRAVEVGPGITSSVILPRGPVQVVRFTLYDSGIFPQRAYAQPGFVTIAIEDLSGGTTGLVVERDTGQAREPRGQVQRLNRQRHGKNELALEPGRYELYMADHPENRAELMVEP